MGYKINKKCIYVYIYIYETKSGEVEEVAKSKLFPFVLASSASYYSGSLVLRRIASDSRPIYYIIAREPPADSRGTRIIVFPAEAIISLVGRQTARDLVAALVIRFSAFVACESDDEYIVRKLHMILIVIHSVIQTEFNRVAKHFCSLIRLSGYHSFFLIGRSGAENSEFIEAKKSFRNYL